MPILMALYSLASLATRYGYRDRILAVRVSPQLSRHALGPTHSPTQLVQGLLHGVKR
jgi:hypothetical protein